MGSMFSTEKSASSVSASQTTVAENPPLDWLPLDVEGAIDAYFKEYFDSQKSSCFTSGSTTVNDFIEEAWRKGRVSPESGRLVEELGEHAPIVCVAVSAFRFARGEATSGDSLQQYNIVCHHVESIASLLRVLFIRLKRRKFEPTKPLEASVSQFLGKLYEFMTDVVDSTPKNFVSLVNSKHNGILLSEIENFLQHTIAEFPSSSTDDLTSISSNDPDDFKVSEVTDMSIIHAYQKVDGEVQLDEERYAAALVYSFGKLLYNADTIEGNDGPSYRQLGLSDIFISPRVTLVSGNRFIAWHGGVSSSQMHDEELNTPAAQQPIQSPKSLEEPSLSVMDLLREGLGQNVVILGDPGTGKTSALRNCALEWAMANHKSRLNMEFPILVELKQFGEAKKHATGNFTLINYIVNGGTLKFPLDATAVLDLFNKRKVVLLLDGLDEVFDSVLRSVVVEEVGSFIQNFHMHARVVITTRISGYHLSELSAFNFTHYRLLPLSMFEIREFLNKWHSRTYTASERSYSDMMKARLLSAIEGNKSMLDLAKSPLLLTMMAIVNRSSELPTKRARLYEKCVELLIARWKVGDAGTSLDNILGGRVSRIFGFEEKKAILQDLAIRMQQDSFRLRNLIRQDLLEAVFSNFVKRSLEREDPAISAALLLQLRERHGILSYLGGNTYAFVHQSFLEYFCALSISNTFIVREIDEQQLDALFRAKAEDESWHEVLCLISGILPAQIVSPCLLSLLSAGRVILAARCLEQLKEFNLSDISVFPIHDALLTLASTGSEDALDVLLRNWPDNVARELASKIAASDDKKAGFAHDLLARTWPDTWTKDLRDIHGMSEHMHLYQTYSDEHDPTAGLPVSTRLTTAKSANFAPVVWIQTEKRFDVFLSFRGNEPFDLAIASNKPAPREQSMRELIVRPIALELSRHFSVFLDEYALVDTMTDVPANTIDDILQGLLSTRGGGVAVLLITRTFLERKWTLAELAACVALHTAGQIRLLVLLLDQSVDDVCHHPFIVRYCPALLNVPLRVLPASRSDHKAVQAWVIAMVREAFGEKFLAVAGNNLRYSYHRLLATISARMERDAFAQANLALALNVPPKPDDLLQFILLRAPGLSAYNVSPLREALVRYFDRTQYADLIDLVERYEYKWFGDWTKGPLTVDLAEIKRRVQTWADLNP